MTFKKVLRRGFYGIPIGVFIGYTITILIALFDKDAVKYYPVVPQLATQMNSEISAVVLQYVLTAIMGFVFSASIAINEMEHWGIAKRTIIHFLIISLTTFPIAYICYWMRHSVFGILSYIGYFTGYYFIGWIAQMLFWMRKIRRINKKLKENK